MTVRIHPLAREVLRCALSLQNIEAAGEEHGLSRDWLRRSVNRWIAAGRPEIEEGEAETCKGTCFISPEEFRTCRLIKAACAWRDKQNTRTLEALADAVDAYRAQPEVDQHPEECALFRDPERGECDCRDEAAALHDAKPGDLLALASATADVARLTSERDEARARLRYVESFARAEAERLADENFRLRAELATIDDAALVENLKAALIEAQAQRDEARADLARLRPVVEAACAFRDEPEPWQTDAWEAIEAAVDTYRAQPEDRREVDEEELAEINRLERMRDSEQPAPVTDAERCGYAAGPPRGDPAWRRCRKPRDHEGDHDYPPYVPAADAGEVDWDAVEDAGAAHSSSALTTLAMLREYHAQTRRGRR